MNQSISKNFTTSTGAVKTISLVKGDIATVPAQAMITSVNAQGMWWGAIDNVINRACGTDDTDNQFHNQIRSFAERHGGRLLQNDVIVAKKKQSHTGRFQDVIFVIDFPSGPLRKVISSGLQAGGEAGYNTVSLPAIRTNVMLGVVEKDAREAVGELLTGITEYFQANPDSSLNHVIFVIYDANSEVMKLLQSNLALE
jgi:O-acetyl-ADP-ribose deacetylase (regulator of RNase III)